MHRRLLFQVTTVLSVSAMAVTGSNGLPAEASPVASTVTTPAPAPDGATSGGAVIVVLKNQHASLKLKAQGAARIAATRSDQQAIVSSIKASGGTDVSQLVSVNAVSATLSAAEVSRLRQDPAVQEIVPNSSVPVQVTAPAPTAGNPAPLSKRLCPANPDQPLLEPEALGVIHYDTGSRSDQGQADTIANGAGVLVAIDGMNELAGNPDLIRPDGSHVVVGSPTPSADDSNDEAYGDATSVAGQGTVVYDYSKELPFSGLPSGCTFVMEGDAPGASLIDASLVDTPTNPDGFTRQTESQIIQGIDHAVITEHADVISESYGFTQRPGRYSLFYAADDAAVAAGVTVVVSSGDSGDSGTVSSPATDPKVIAVGATNTLRLMAQAAAPITFRVPRGLDRLNTDLIIPDPVNATILSYQLIGPDGALTQISYDYGTPSSRAGQLGSTPNIQHVEVADPTPGTWTAKILWANGRAHLQSPPNVPGTFSGDVSFRVTGQRFFTSRAVGPVTIPAHSSVTVPLQVRMPTAAGDHPESVQFAGDDGATTSLPVTRRTLIPAAGGRFAATITSTVGRGVGQISTYDVSVPPGENDLDVSFTTPDASADNKLTYYLINPSGTVVAEDATPTTTTVGSPSPVADADLITIDPAPGLWEIDVELNLTVSGLEFSQVVQGEVSYNQVQISAANLPTSASTMIASGGSYAVVPAAAAAPSAPAVRAVRAGRRS